MAISKHAFFELLSSLGLSRVQSFVKAKVFHQVKTEKQGMFSHYE